jgi:hypothetical protein
MTCEYFIRTDLTSYKLEKAEVLILGNAPNEDAAKYTFSTRDFQCYRFIHSIAAARLVEHSLRRRIRNVFRYADGGNGPGFVWRMLWRPYRNRTANDNPWCDRP